MATAAELFRRRRAQSEGILPPTDEETQIPWLSAVLAAPADAAWGVLDAIDYVDSATRALLGRVIGVDGGGRDTLFGAAPSGRELLGIGHGTPGEFESGDIGGFLVEAAASPLNFLGIGALTAAGKTATRAGALARAARVAEAQGAGEKAAVALEKLKDLGFTLADAPRRGANFAEQARQGQRSLLSLDVPIIGVNQPLSLTGGRVSGAVFGGLDRVLAGASRSAAPIIDWFQAGRALRPKLLEEQGVAGADELASLWTENRMQAQEVRRGALADALPDVEALAAATRGLKSEDAAAILDEVSVMASGLRDRVEQEYAPRVNDLVRRIAKAELAGEAAKVERMRRGLKRLELRRDMRLARLAVSTGGDPAQRLVNEALSRGPETIAKIQRDEAKLTDQIASIAARAEELSAERLRRAGLPGGVFGALAEAEQKNARTQRWAAARIAAIGNRASSLKIDREFAELLPRVLASRQPELAHRVARVQAALGQALASEQAAGVAVSELTDPLLSYAPRVLTEQGRTWLSKQPQGTVWSRVVAENRTTGGFVRQRVPEWRGLSVPQINDLARRAGFDGELIAENATEALLRRFTAGADARAGASLWAGALDLFALPPALAGEGAVPIVEAIRRSGLTRVGNISGLSNKADEISKAVLGSELQGMAVPAELVRNLERVFRIVEDPDSLRGVIRTLDRINGIYRLAMTQFFPAFHARNLYSNAFNAILAAHEIGASGAGLVREFGAAAATLRRMAKGTATEADLADWRSAVEFGSAGRGHSREIAAMIGVSPEDTTRSGLARGAVRGALRFGEAIDDAAKLALYRYARRKGLTAQEAGRLTQKYLHDYEDISRTEKSVLRRGAYFWTWMRKNTPLMFAAVVAHPRRMRLYGLAVGEGGSRREQREDLPPWVRDRLPFDLGDLSEYGIGQPGERSFIGAGLPVEDVLRFGSEGRGAGRVAQKLLALLAPTYRVPIELATNYNLGMGRVGAPDRGVVRAIAESSPPWLREQIFPLATLEASSPASRFSSVLPTLMGLAAQDADRLPPDAALSLIGVQRRGVRPEEERRRQALRRINAALDRYEGRGEADTDRAAALRRLQRRLREQGA